MNRDKGRFRNVTLLAGFFALALVAAAFLHLCLSTVDHGMDCDPTHHCPLCTVFSCTILVFFIPCLFASPLFVHLPPLLEPICGGTPSVLVSVPVRAPPSTKLNRKRP
jgi:hypothetical protein